MHIPFPTPTYKSGAILHVIVIWMEELYSILIFHVRHWGHSKIFHKSSKAQKENVSFFNTNTTIILCLDILRTSLSQIPNSNTLYDNVIFLVASFEKKKSSFVYMIALECTRWVDFSNQSVFSHALTRHYNTWHMTDEYEHYSMWSTVYGTSYMKTDFAKTFAIKVMFEWRPNEYYIIIPFFTTLLYYTLYHITFDILYYTVVLYYIMLYNIITSIIHYCYYITPYTT